MTCVCGSELTIEGRVAKCPDCKREWTETEDVDGVYVLTFEPEQAKPDNAGGENGKA